METYRKRKEKAEKDFIRKGWIEQRERRKKKKGEDNTQYVDYSKPYIHIQPKHTHKRLLI